MSTIREELTQKIELDAVNELWFITNIQGREGGLIVSTVKRLFNLVLSILVLIVYVIVFPVLSFLITRDGGEIFIKMPRIGVAGKFFTIKKLRSMTPDPVGE